jgi:hyperosmotically inducible periplasmic protein
MESTMKKVLFFPALALGLVLFTSGCSQSQQDKAQTESSDAAAKAKNAASEAADKTKDAAGDAADKTKAAAQDAGQAMQESGLTAKVKSKLAADVKLSTLTSINVDSNDSVVTLTGTVPTPAAKVAAGKVAHSVDGVTKVVNHLEVSK